ncbi:MAG: hypothetical protein RLZZ58_1180, partial [Pseudomonadota bacterium]
MATVFGYPATGWTLKTDLVGHYVCRLLTHMDHNGWAVATPKIADEDRSDEAATFNLKSGYLLRSLDELPRSGVRAPWRLNQSYLVDKPIMLQEPVADGMLAFSNASGGARVAPKPRARKKAATLEPAA